MSGIKTLTKNTAAIMLSQLFSRISSFVLIVCIARYLNDVGLGRYAFALSFTGLFVVLSEIGLRELLIREVARKREAGKKFLNNAIGIKIVFSLLAFGLMCVVINLFHYPQETTFAVYIIGISVIFNSVARLINSLFCAYERMEYESISVVVERIVSSGLGVWLLVMGRGLREVALALLIGSFFNVMISLYLTSRKITKLSVEMDWGFWKRLLKDALPFGIVYIFVIIYFQIDTVMLSLMKGDAIVGWYNAAYKLIFALQIIPVAFVSALFPIISRFFVSSKDSLKIAFERSFKYLFIIGFPLAVGTTLLGEKIILSIYGKEFLPSVASLKILIWVATIMFLTYLFGNVLGSIDKQITLVKVAGLNALVNILMNLLLIPKFSHIGASIATFVTECVGFMLYFIFLSKYLHRLPLAKLTFKPIAAGILMGIFILTFGDMSWLLLASLSAVLYFLALFLLKTLNREEVLLFKKALGFD